MKNKIYHLELTNKKGQKQAHHCALFLSSDNQITIAR